MRFIGSVIVLFSVWLLMSGVYKPLVIGFGLASTLVALLVVFRMDKTDRDVVLFDLKPVAFVKYFIWLLKEIAVSNWNVSKIICSGNMPINQHLFTVPVSQKSELGQVIYANSITLTPGTITVETEGDHFIVHAVDFADSTPDDLADMDRRVTITEGGRS